MALAPNYSFKRTAASVRYYHAAVSSGRLTQALAGMDSSSVDLLKILRIGRETSIRGEGISLQEAIASSHYKNLRLSFVAADLIPLIGANPALITEWLLYSEDKRTQGGWYLQEPGEVGELASGVRLQFPSMQSAVAHYVVLELDFWAGVAG